MAKKKVEPEEGGSWMDTYGDMVTLLLTFFVALYSMTSINDETWAKLIKAFNASASEEVQQVIVIMEDDGSGIIDTPKNGVSLPKPPEGDPPEDFDITKLAAAIRQAVEDSGMQEQIQVETASDSEEGNTSKQGFENIYIQFSSEVLFYGDKADMLDSAKPVVEAMGNILKQNESEIQMILIKGFTANVPSPVDSWELSLARAGTIVKYFNYTSKIDSLKLNPSGMGSKYPIASNDIEEGRRLNRRVEIVIIPTKNSSNYSDKQWEDIYGSYYAGKYASEIAGILEQ